MQVSCYYCYTYNSYITYLYRNRTTRTKIVADKENTNISERGKKRFATWTAYMQCHYIWLILQFNANIIFFLPPPNSFNDDKKTICNTKKNRRIKSIEFKLCVVINLCTFHWCDWINKVRENKNASTQWHTNTIKLNEWIDSHFNVLTQFNSRAVDIIRTHAMRQTVVSCWLEY